MLDDKVLLFPQTCFYCFFDEKELPFSQIYYLKLPFFVTEENNRLVSIIPDLPWEENLLKKEFQALCDWGLNFRTPEVLKYFLTFKDRVEGLLEENLPYVSLKPPKKEPLQELKNALFLLGLAEKFDREIKDIKESLESIEERYHHIFEEKIIGEDETFEELKEIKNLPEPFIDFKSLSFLNERLVAWKILLPRITFPDLSSLLITERALIEKFAEVFEIKELGSSQDFKIFSAQANIIELISLEKKDSQFPTTIYLKE